MKTTTVDLTNSSHKETAFLHRIRQSTPKRKAKLKPIIKH
jgi:hypothetical protein